MYELKKIGKVFTNKYIGTGPSSYEKRIYRAAVSQRVRNTGLGHVVLLVLTDTWPRPFSVSACLGGAASVKNCASFIAAWTAAMCA